MHLFYGWFQLLTLSTLSLSWQQKVVHIYTIQQLKDVGLLKFVWRFGTTRHEKVNKIHVHGFHLGPAKNHKKYKKASSLLLAYLLSHFLSVYII